jgi:hypothetical protein
MLGNGQGFEVFLTDATEVRPCEHRLLQRKRIQVPQ